MSLVSSKQLVAGAAPVHCTDSDSIMSSPMHRHHFPTFFSQSDIDTAALQLVAWCQVSSGFIQTQSPQIIRYTITHRTGSRLLKDRQ